MKQLNKEEAIKFYDSHAWKYLSDKERSVFQIEQQLLCMPFSVFHKSIEASLGRRVWTHEFGSDNASALRQELMGLQPPPSLEDIKI